MERISELVPTEEDSVLNSCREIALSVSYTSVILPIACFVVSGSIAIAFLIFAKLLI